MARLLKQIKECNENKTFTYEALEDVYNILLERVDWLEEREPESDGVVYENWSDTYEALTEITDNIEELIYDIESEEEDLDISKSVEEIFDSILQYQEEFGGLSRL